MPIKVLHVEVGGSYGGSLKALETYLAYSDLETFEHEVLFYYPGVSFERLQPWVRSIKTLHQSPLPPAPKTKPAANRWLRRALTRLGLAQAASQAWDWCRIALNLPSVWKLARLLRAGGYDLIHVNNTFSYQPLTLLAAQIARIPVIAHVRNPVPPGLLSRALMRLVRCVVSVNTTFARELRAWHVPVSICTCHDGVLLDRPDSDASAMLRRSFAPPEAILIGSAGRLDEQKGFDTLVRAAKIVVDEHPNALFLIAGEGPLFSSLTALIAELGMKDNVHLCGYQPQVQNFLFALDVFVNSSNWEGLPLALLEAMILGKPSVVTDVGGNAEVVKIGTTGLVVPARNPVALAQAISVVLRNRDSFAEGTRRAAPAILRLTDTQRTAILFEHAMRDAVHPGRSTGTRGSKAAAAHTGITPAPDLVDAKPQRVRLGDFTD